MTFFITKTFQTRLDRTLKNDYELIWLVIKSITLEPDAQNSMFLDSFLRQSTDEDDLNLVELLVDCDQNERRRMLSKIECERRT